MPLNRITSLPKINLNKTSRGGALPFILLEKLLSKVDIIGHRTPSEKSILQRTNDSLQNSSYSCSKNFRDHLVNHIAIGDRFEIIGGGYMSRFRHKINNRVIDLTKQLARAKEILSCSTKIRTNNIPRFLEEHGGKPIRTRRFIITNTEESHLNVLNRNFN